MCLGIPMQVRRVDGYVAECEDGDRRETVDISLVPTPVPGDWLLVHLGSARQPLDAASAQRIRQALDALGLVMQGGDVALRDEEIDRLFADLVDREPPLPPHLQSARIAGEEPARAADHSESDQEPR